MTKATTHEMPPYAPPTPYAQKPAFPDRCAFIRMLNPEDARQIETLCRLNPEAPEEGERIYGVFNDVAELIAMFGTSREAFEQAAQTKFMLQWLH